jgi:hypothetical protein
VGVEVGICPAIGNTAAVNNTRRLRNVSFIASILPKTKMYEKRDLIAECWVWKREDDKLGGFYIHVLISFWILKPGDESHVIFAAH